MFTTDELAIAFPHEISLELSSQAIDAAWVASRNHSNDAACWQAYLNRLSLDALLPWLQSLGSFQPPKDNEVSSIWEVVNGTAIALDRSRIVLIPSDAMDTEEFCVSQEWIDIPTWVADYYLAVQVNADDGWLRVCGYASHQQLKEQGRYSSLMHTYAIDGDDLIRDLSALPVSLRLVADTQAAIASLPILSVPEAEALLAQLSQPSLYSPRLDVPFVRWGTLLQDKGWLGRLYNRRLQLQTQAQQQSRVAIAPLEAAVTNLSQWFENVFETGWQTLDRLFEPGSPNLALAFRSDASPTSIQRGKVVNLGMQIGVHPVVLLVILTAESDGRVGVILRVYPFEDRVYLPVGIKLSVLDESGNTFRETLPARSNDNLIQLQFTGKAGARFGVKIKVGDLGITEQFAIAPNR